MLLKKSVELNIDLNAKDTADRTALHWACINGHFKIVEIILKKSTELNIDLNTANVFGQTAFYEAYIHGHSKTAEMQAPRKEWVQTMGANEKSCTAEFS